MKIGAGGLRTLLLALCLAPGLALQAGCAALVTPVDANAPLRMALTDPVEDLIRRSDAGEDSAQYALSFLKKYGLRGVEKDQDGVEGLRVQAARGGTMPITQYIPGINGAPGRVNMIYVQMPGISPQRARIMDVCGLSLLTGLAQYGAIACGSPEAYAALLPAVADIVPRDGLIPSPFAEDQPVDPNTVVRCEAVGPLWNDAGRRFDAGDMDGAAAASDRIIALCGEDQLSWHPRIMRALIANTKGKADEALAFIAPVPRPAPAPIGSYASFVAMQARIAKGDWAGYGAERDRLMQASETALRAESWTRAAGEPVEGAGSRFQIFDRPLPMGDNLKAVRVALLISAAERNMARAFYLTASVDIMDPTKTRYFLDEYRCDGRSTLKSFGVLPAPPGVEEMRDLIGQRLAGALTETSGSSFLRGPNACQFPVQVAPGLGDDFTAFEMSVGGS
jgi:hypothetical protein